MIKESLCDSKSDKYSCDYLKGSIYMNYPLISSLIAIIFTQLIKYPIAKQKNKGAVDINIVTSTGGMPSSHSAATSSLITALALQYGVSSPYVSIAVIFGVIVMFDSMGVRRQSGEQGVVLDHLIKKGVISPESLSFPDDKPYQDFIVRKYLGHKPSEVIGGVLTGILLALVLYQVFPL